METDFQNGNGSFKEGNIEYSYDNICNYIKNRDGTDMCPIEKMAMDIEDPILLLDRIKITPPLILEVE